MDSGLAASRRPRNDSRENSPLAETRLLVPARLASYGAVALRPLRRNTLVVVFLRGLRAKFRRHRPQPAGHGQIERGARQRDALLGLGAQEIGVPHSQPLNQGSSASVWSLTYDRAFKRSVPIYSVELWFVECRA